MAWLILTVTSSILFLQILRWTQHVRGNLPTTVSINYLLGTIGCLLLLDPIPTGPSRFAVAIIGAGLGVIYASNLYLIAAVVRRIGLALATGTMALSTAAPVAVSAAYGDPWTDKIPGLGIALLAAPALALARSTLNGRPGVTRHSHRVLWALALFAMIGAEQSLFKVAEQVGGAGFEQTMLPALFSFALIASLPQAFAARRRQAAWPRDVLRGLMLGSANLGSNLSFAFALHQTSGTIIFPLRHILVILGSTVLGMALWHERLNRLGIVGILLSVVAVVLLST